jgi:hypothetical protein
VNGSCTVGLIRETLLLTGREISTLLRILNWVSSLRTYWYLSVLLYVRTFNFVPNLLFQLTGPSGVGVVRKVWMLQAGEWSSLSSDDTWVTCFKEYCLPLSVFKDEVYHLCATSPLWREWKKFSGSSEKIIYVGSKSVQQVV